MREIKFRGQTTKKEWVYGSLYIGELDGQEYAVILNNKTTSVANDLPDRIDLAFDRGDVHVVYPATVGQYTGLKDKNGKEIYEGDIVNDVVTINGSVYSQDYVIEHSEPHCGFVGIAVQRLLTPSCFDDVKVIGNIHDNPELLNNGCNE